MEVVKIRLQAQQHSLADPLEAPRYRNAGHAVYKIVREEGFATLYRGVSLTALRQATNQGAFVPFSFFVGWVGWVGLRVVEVEGALKEEEEEEGREGGEGREEDGKAEADEGFTAHRGELYGVPGAEEGRAQVPARAR